MKTIIIKKVSAAMLIVSIFVASCSEKDPLPLSNASFTITTDSPERYQEVKFENLSTNASSYIWDFGDGSPISTEIAPTHIYEDSDNYTVTLEAFTEDNQVSTIKEEIRVGERYLTGIYIINVNMKDTQGKSWDNDGSGPDVLMQFGPINYTSDDQITGFYVESLNTGEFETPIGISTIDILPNDYKLTNEEYFILLEEVDSVNNQPTYTTMIETRFNPVAVDGEVFTEIIRGNGTGDLTIPFVVVDEYQFFLEFEIR